MLQVLKYSQADILRVQKQWELDYQARLLAKERDWVLKSEVLIAEAEEKYARLDEENSGLNRKIVHLQMSHEDMK